jgi:hypothetical protein
MTTRLRTPHPGTRRAMRCDRCAAAGVRRHFLRLTAPYWDPTYRLCPACAHALAELFDTTNTWPRRIGERFPTPPDTTGAPHYLHCPHTTARRAA